MIEDKLEHDERVRLECLAQAVAMHRPTLSPAAIVDAAAEFEQFVKEGKRS